MSSAAVTGDRRRELLLVGGFLLAATVVVTLTQTRARPVVYVALLVPLVVATLARSRRDAVSLIWVYLVLLLLVPSRFAFTLFSQAVTPSVLVGLALLWLWACLLIVPHLGLAAGAQPVRLAVLFFLWSLAISWALAFLRPLPEVESRQALIGYLGMASAVGVALLAADGVRTRVRLDALLGWLVAGACLVALIGIVQFATGFDISRYLRVPGLETTAAGDTFIDIRSTLRRVQSTTEHPIEMAVLLTSVLPLALHYARNSGLVSRMGARMRWGAVLVLLVGVPLTISRAGVVGLAVACLALIVLWPTRQKILLVLGVAGFAAGMRLAVPGLVGTLLSLFENAGTDPSITHRLGDYGAAAPYIANAPWFGRGFHTFIYSYYFVVDNQYLSSLIETGLVGTAALLAVFLVGIAVAMLARRQSRDPIDRDLGHALAVSILVAGVGFFSFDALSFPTVTGVTFLLVGCAGAYWRIQRSTAQPAGRPMSGLPS